MTTLDDTLRELAAAGRLKHLLVGRASENRFQASFETAGKSYHIGIDEDPVMAIHKAIGDRSTEPVVEDFDPLDTLL